MPPVARRRRHLSGATVLAAAGVLAFWACSPKAFANLMGMVSRSHAANARTALHAAGDEAEEVWRQAYELEVDRATLLRDQILANDNKASEGSDFAPKQDTEDWEKAFHRLQTLNDYLEARLHGGSFRTRARTRKAASKEVIDNSGVPVTLAVDLDDGQTSISVFRRHGARSSFLTVTAALPLGLNISYQERGQMRNAFVVENLVEGGSLHAENQVRPGDVLHAVSTMVRTLGATNFDSGMAFSQQSLTDASNLKSVNMMVEAIQTNTAYGRVILVFERAPEEVAETVGEPIASTA